MNVKHSLPLLGGISPEQFMRQYWQKKPLLIRAAVPDFKPLLGAKELLGLAAQEEVESRLVEQTSQGWRLTPGPICKPPSLKKPNWTLLVQGMDLHSDGAHALLQQFRFVPDARLDDLMISLAGQGGGVGPHFDSYDVFLLQAAGRRRWQISKQKDLTLAADAPLKILQNFKPTQEFILEPGDMLYLPPRYAHDGVALDAGCQTYSIGFRAPKAGELAREILHRLAEEIGDALDEDGDEVDPAWLQLYTDPAQEATEQPAKFPAALQNFALQALQRALADKQLLKQLVGEYMTDPKAGSVLDEADASIDEAGLPKVFKQLHLSRATRMSYDAKLMFINGQSFICSGNDAKILRQLANDRFLLAIDLVAASQALIRALGEFRREGWLIAR